MDGYPRGSLDHNVPFLVASGLSSAFVDEVPGDSKDQDHGVALKSELSCLTGESAEVLEKYLQSIDATQPPWIQRDKKTPYRYRVVSVGRAFRFPARHASLPDDIEPPEEAILHSPFSPLSPASPLYPDGLIDTQWLRKHQELVPSVYLCFYTLTSDPTRSTLDDNKLKADINAIKAEIAKSGYKTRLAVALMSDTTTSPGTILDGIQERLENIRKGTGLATGRTIFYIAPRESLEELTDAVDTILTALYPQSLEYYRDLVRHTRKKRSRGIIPQPTVPPTTGTSQTLSLPGWYVRYDFKAAVFSEFRQEMDVAIRSYEQAYDGLLSQEVWDLIPSWSPRWNEARLLSDIIAIRVLRCFLWNEQTSMAVSRWQVHRDRIADFINRRGRGTNNYGWQAWETRWSLVMANLIEGMDIQALRLTKTLYLQPEKGVPRDRHYPWELMHHTGYWYRQAARHTAIRRALAYSIPEEDRRTPDASPATSATNNVYTYDTYMCPAPHEEFPLEKPGIDYSQLIMDSLTAAKAQFQARGQRRLVAETSLDCAKEAATLEQWDNVTALLLPIWEDMPFRKEGWTDITEDINWTLRPAAAKKGLADVVLTIDWELLHRKFSRRNNWSYDLSRSLDGIDSSSKPTVSLSDDTNTSFLSAAFVFKSEQGKAGETSVAQLTITSDAFPDSPPVQLSEVRLEFEGTPRPIVITHDPASVASPKLRGNTVLSKVGLKVETEVVEEAEEKEEEEEEEAEGSDCSETLTPIRGTADLLLSPGQTRVYEMAIPLRDPGDARAKSTTVIVDTDDFRLEYTISFKDIMPGSFWVDPSGFRRKMGRDDPHHVHVEPRPPKMEIKPANVMDQFYANEPITLEFELVNAEDEDAVTKLDIHAFGDSVPSATVKIAGLPDVTAPPNSEASKLIGTSLGTIKSSDKVKIQICLDAVAQPSSLEFHVRASYHLVSDPGTRILQKDTFTVNVVSPFEANYEFAPRLHPDPWPSVFDPDTIRDASDEDEESVQRPLGLAQKWCLVCRYASFATEDLQIVGLDAQVLSSTGDIRCATANGPLVPGEGLRVAPRAMQEARFDITAQKLSLDDRAPATLDLALVLRWKRLTSDSVNTTTLLTPRYAVLGTEPRVLASASAAPPVGGEGLMDLDVTIENPSSHFLTFGITMEPSDEFAFSGPKRTTVHVLPMSRRVSSYRLLPLVRGAFFRPGLVVKDKYFQKVLRVLPTGGGMKADKEGLVIWAPGESGEEGEEGEDEDEEGASP
ncbi:uncharacterized protein DNG_07575 [Cephalotrichum gorgonifer]|uniref:Trafficking protein particle complex subunit 11 n=1 Tax=Cephalotrichum gorgonifer TaxID=2041049 RepID=A0AAE8SXJ4_9PEZI|nr:uncharacterized protein DNG_07575 [Cephalotrichum gorgonifer]